MFVVMMIPTILLMMFSVVSIALGQETSKDRFPTPEACKAAVLSGNFEYYRPSFLSNHREPGEGEDIRPLEERGCVDLHIVGGRAFVPQPKGERYIFKGSQALARYDCGNDAGTIEYVPQQPPPQPDEVIQIVKIDVAAYVATSVIDLIPWNLTSIPPFPPVPEGEAVALVYDKGGDKLKWVPCVGFVAHPSWGRAAYCGVVVGTIVAIVATEGGAAVLLGSKPGIATISPKLILGQ